MVFLINVFVPDQYIHKLHILKSPTKLHVLSKMVNYSNLHYVTHPATKTFSLHRCLVLCQDLVQVKMSSSSS